MKLKIKAFKLGNSYATLLPKTLIDWEVFEEGQEYELELLNKTAVGTKKIGRQTKALNTELENDHVEMGSYLEPVRASAFQMYLQQFY
jgi:antitoxin component of MazEF toxin-antitoxin module